MEYVRGFIELYDVEITIALIGSFLVLLLLYIVAQVKISKLKRRYKVLVKGSDAINIEGLLLENEEDIEGLKDSLKVGNKNIENLNEKLASTVQKIGFVRYNAFSEMGSEMSFSIVFLDDFNSGIVLTSIYGREQSTSYAKPIENGKSTYPLSAEEIQALDRAIKNEKAIDI